MALIEREDAIKAALDWKVKPDDEVFAAIKTAITSNLEQVAAVDAAPVVHSSWHWTQDGYVYCENCTFPLAKTKVNIDGVERHLYLTTNYCAHCGAKMDGEQEAQDG